LLRIEIKLFYSMAYEAHAAVGEIAIVERNIYIHT